MKELLAALNPDNSCVFNRTLAHAIGLHEAIIYSALIAKYCWYENKGKISDCWFYSTAEDLEESTCLSQYQQEKAIKNLVSLKLIDKKIFGIPSKRYFAINLDEEVLKKILQRSQETKNQASEKLESKDLRNCEPRIQETANLGFKKLESKDSRNCEPRFQETKNLGFKKLESKDSRNLKENISKRNVSKETLVKTTTTKHSDGSCCGGDSDSAFKDIVNLYQDNIQPLTGITAEKLEDLLDECGAVNVTQAIEVASEQNKRSFAYVRGVAHNLLNGTSRVKPKAEPTGLAAIDELLREMKEGDENAASSN